ncbi:MAG TPA: hypothetical protein ENN40_08180 [Candidatus Aminicenantes bacterium]|nr:hypothetical protein [Candidatus Aminicenantes bacterium]
MVKRFFGPAVVAFLLVLMVFTGCGRRYRTPQLAPPGQQGHASVVIRFVAETRTERQKGRVVLDTDGRRARMLFLNPLNRVVMDLHVELDRATLVNRGRKRYWRGDFRELIRRIWQLRLEFADLRRLLFDAVAPRALTRQAGLRVQVERDTDSGLPVMVQITDGIAQLRITVLRRRRVAGVLDSPRSLESLVQADLEEVISHED